MKEHILENGLKIIYKNTTSKLTSISISLDAGAAVEGEKLGIAHATEHMVYKGTKKRSESEINRDLSNVFGFQNAMTNYPYVIYYGTLLSEDFEEGVEIFSDIIINPTFKEDGFKEEMDVIMEELKEWDEELEQYCEDSLFLNAFNNRRIKYPIIGSIESLKSITLEDIKDFYKEFYCPGNISIGIVSSLDFEEVKNIIENYFANWSKDNSNIYSNSDMNSKLSVENRDFENIVYENPKEGTFINYRNEINTCKVLMIYPINSLNIKELKALRIFNEYFGEGVNSILYDKLRTENGLVYDVLTKIAYEKHIKLYKINFSTSNENLDETLKLINECIDELKNIESYLDEDKIKQFIKILKLKRLFREEQSIILAKELSTYSTMFNDYKVYTEELNGLEELTSEFIFNVARKVLKNPSIEIVKNR